LTQAFADARYRRGELTPERARGAQQAWLRLRKALAVRRKKVQDAD